MMSKLRKQKGFTLIELLIVVAIIGIIAAILIPNFLDALHKGRQKRTMGDQRQFGLGIGQYYTEHSGAAAAGASTITVGDWDGTGSTTDSTVIETALVPDYIATMPKQDGWGHDFLYHVTLDNPPRTHYALVISGGRDNSGGEASYTSGTFPPTDYDQDLVWADGSFLRAPQSAQQGGT